MRRTPALIVGGGPAGAAAATLLARARMPHLLIERTRETGDALCGGFLSWRSLQSLRSIGIDPAVLNPQDVTRVRLFHRHRVAETRLPQPAKGVSRRRLDAVMMAHAIDCGAAVERGVTVRSAEGNRVGLAGGETIAADALFLGTGKHDLRGLGRPSAARGSDPSLGFRLRLGASPHLDALVGDAIELHLFDRGYAGLVLQEDGSANLCLAVHRSRLDAAGSPEALIDALAAECPALGERLAWRTSDVIDAVANVPYGWRAREGATGLFRMGDQAGVIPSLAGEGMGIAIASGIRAARAYEVHGADGGTAYQRRLARDLYRPLGLAGFIRRAAESRYFAAALVGVAEKAPFLIDLAARSTRIGYSAVDANRNGRESLSAWNT